MPPEDKPPVRPDLSSKPDNVGAELNASRSPSVDVWNRIKAHKVVQWTLAYGAGAYTLLHIVEMVSAALDWPHVIARVVTVGLILGVPMAATVAWYHGHRAAHRVSGPELAILTVLLFIAGSVLWFVGSSKGQNARLEHTGVGNSSGTDSISSSAPPERSIAVLPFLDLSEKKDQEYLADGIAEEILDVLAKVPSLKVIARTSSFQFKGKAEDLRNVAATLGVHYVVEGSVRRSGDHLRITAQLINAHDDSHVWSNTYDRGPGDAIAVEDEIAQSIGGAVGTEFAARDLASRHRYTPSPEAYDAFLRAAHTTVDRAGIEEQIALLQQALRLDKHFTAAAEALAVAFQEQADFGFVAPQTGFEQARRACQDVLELDPSSGVAHSYMAMIHLLYDWDWDAARIELKKASATDPSSKDYLNASVRFHLAVGELSEAEHEITALEAIDPLNSFSQEFRSWLEIKAGQPSEAEKAARKALRLTGSYSYGHYWLAKTLFLQGKLDEALQEAGQDTEADGRYAIEAMAYYALGRREEADRALGQLKDLNSWQVAVAEAYAMRGDRSQALAWLERGYAMKDSDLQAIYREPLLKNLAGDPGFKAFMRKMRFPD